MKQANLLTTFALFALTLQASAAGRWVPLKNAPPVTIGHFLLLSDGTVMGEANPYGPGSGWYRLVPDAHGSYINGTWTNMATMNSTRLDFDSLVLTNGKVLVAGGEYGTGRSTAELYDPVSNIWTTLSIPTSVLNPSLPSATYGNLQGFVDSCAIVLSNGLVLIAPVEPNAPGGTVIYNPGTSTWSLGPNCLGAANSQNEASWVQLADGSVLTVNLNTSQSQRYIPASNSWVADANVPVSLYSIGGELGPGLLLPNGKAMFFGGTSNTAIYTVSGTASPGSWAAGPNFPNSQGMPDAPGAVMVNGKILCATSRAPYTQNGTNYIYNTPTSFYEYDYVSNSFTQVGAPGGGLTLPDVLFAALMVDLPDGTVLFGHRQSDFYIYIPDGVPMTNGKPTISSITGNPNGTIHLTGKLFNGLSAGASYGDDEQMDSNFPLVRFTDTNGIIRYGRTFNWSGSGVRTGTNTVSTDCVIPPGASTNDNVQVVVNGVESGYNPVVENTNDFGPGSLRYLTQMLPSGSTITFAAYLSGQKISTDSGEILLTNNLTIDATGLPGGIRIDGLHTNRAFELAGGYTVIMKGLTLTNCYVAAASGGAVLNFGLLTLDRCTLINNFADSAQSGGAIENVGTLTLTGCTLSGNTAGFAGAMRNDGNCLMVNCTLAANTAPVANGGAIDNVTGTLVLRQCTFSGNSTAGLGGAIDNYLGTVNVTNSIVSGNTPQDIYNWASSTINAGGSNLVQSLGNAGTNNGAATLNPSPALLQPLGYYGGITRTMPPQTNSPAIDGGVDSAAAGISTDQTGAPRLAGLHVDIGAVELSAGPVVFTTADSGYGSLRYAATYLPTNTTITFATNLAGQTIRLTSGEIALNKNLTIDASALAGSIKIDGNHNGRILEVLGASTVVLKSLMLSNGYVTADSGGALAISPGSSVIATNCSFLANTAQGGNGQNRGAGNNGGGGGGGSGMGGAIFQNGSSLLLSGCQLIGNVAGGGNGGNGDGNSFNGDSGGQGGGPNAGAGGPAGSPGGIGGFGGGGGGGAGSGFAGFAGGNGGFGGGGGGGGALGGGGSGGAGGLAGTYAGAGGPALFSHSGGGGGGAGLGGAIFVQGGNVTLINCSFTGNLATNGVGGAGSFGAGVGGPGSGVGGAVFNNSGSVNGYGLAFNNNNASTSLPDMDFSTVVQNNNDSGPGSLRQAVYNANAHSGAQAVTFASGFIAQTVHLTSGEIVVADTGGAVTVDASGAGGLTVDGNGISRIFELYPGAALTLDSVTITNGFQADAGGGILNNQGTLTVRRCSFLGNHSSFAGGAVRNLFAPALMTAENCTFALNSANQEGGAILNDGGPTLVLRQCTVVSNTAFSSAGGLDLFNGPVTLAGCIVAQNSAPASPDVKTSSATVTAAYNLVRDGTGSGIANGANGNQVGSGPAPIEPRLGTLANNGGPTLTLWPLGGSPAVDAGDPLFNAFGLTDQRGYSRVAGSRVDIGAVETGLRTFYTFDNFTAVDLFGSSVATYQGSPSGPWWNSDHRAQANSAIALNDVVGGTPFGTNNYYRITTPGDPTNSFRGLGLQGDFTVTAWVFPRIEGGYKTVVGNAGTAGVSVLMGLNGGNTVFVFGGIGLNGGRGVPTGQYTHLAWTYNSQGGQMAIYVNGQLDSSNVGIPNNAPNTNLLLGFNESLAGSHFEGMIDEFAIFDGALSPSQIATLATPAFRADSLMPAPALSPGLTSGACQWNVVEAYAHGGDPFVFPTDLPSAEYVAWTPQLGKSTNYTSSVINRFDPDVAIGVSVPFLATATPFLCNNLTPQGLINGDDNYFVLAASTTLVITDESDYTFGFASDDGARLRLIGGVFTSSTRLDTGNVANPAHRGDTLAYPNPTGNSSTLGVAHLKPGTYGLEFITYEVNGSAWAEVFAARGAKTSLDSSFQLLSPYVFAPRPALSLTRVSAAQVQANWSPSTACDRLQTASSVTGPWTDVPGATNGQVFAVSPGQHYYRVAH